MKQRISVPIAGLALFAALLLAGPTTAAPAAVQSYTGCLSPILNAIYDVAPGDAPAHGCIRPASVIHLSSGDVTSLAAGTGLAGGGDNGDVSLSLAPTYRLPQSCTNGQTPAWNGTAWGCASTATYSAGEGLALNGTQFSVANGGVTQAKLAFDPTTQSEFNAFTTSLGSGGTVNEPSNPVDWSQLKGVPPGLADGVDNTGGGDPLSGYCALVQAHPRSFEAAPCGAYRQTLDTAGDSTSIAIGADGNPVVGYGVVAGTQLKVAHCTDRVCAASTLNALDGTAFDVSIAIGRDGNPVVSYRRPSAAVKVAHCANPACASPTQLTTLDSVGFRTSIAIGSDGNPVVSYSGPGGALTVAHCDDPACSTSTRSQLDSFGDYTSIAIGTDGNPVVSYTGLGGVVKVARCSDPACTVSTLNPLGFVGDYTSIAIGTDGNPVVSYSGPNGELAVSICGDPACGSSGVSVLDGIGDFTSIAIGADGNPVVSYRGPGDALKIAKCTDSGCAGSTLHTLDSVGLQTSIAIGTDGNPVVSYQGPGGALKLARPAISN